MLAAPLLETPGGRELPPAGELGRVAGVPETLTVQRNLDLVGMRQHIRRRRGILLLRVATPAVLETSGVITSVEK